MAAKKTAKKTRSGTVAKARVKTRVKSTVKPKSAKTKIAKAKTASGTAKKKSSGNKTVPVKKTAAALLAGVKDEQKRADSNTLLKMMKKITGKPPVVWGGSIIGFGLYQYKYASGREGEFFIAGFAPRVQNIVVYIMSGFAEETELMKRLGKHKTGKACLYLNKLADVDVKVLNELITRSVAHMRKKYKVK